MEITDRIAEQKILATRLASTEAELIAIYGSRRVGKTFLVRTFCKDEIVFEFTGNHGATILPYSGLSLAAKCCLLYTEPY